MEPVTEAPTDLRRYIQESWSLLFHRMENFAFFIAMRKTFSALIAFTRRCINTKLNELG